MTLCEMLGRNHKEVTYMARHLTRSRDRANDLISETLVWMESRNRKIPQIDKEFKLWYYRCMYFVMLAPGLGYRKMYSPKEVLLDYDTETKQSEQEEDANELIGVIHDEVRKVIDSFSGTDKILFELIYTHKLTYREIAYIYKQKTGHEIREISIHRMAKPMKQKLKAKWNI